MDDRRSRGGGERQPDVDRQRERESDRRVVEHGAVGTTTTDTNAANNSVTQGTAVVTSADLSLTKTDAADPVARGSNVSYTLTAVQRRTLRCH